MLANRSIGNAISTDHLPAQISFYRSDDFQYQGSRTVQSATAITDWAVPADVLPGGHGYHAGGTVSTVIRAVLDAPFAADATSGTVSSMDAYAGAGSIIRYNVFRNLAVRGVLFQSIEGRIEDNQFSWIRGPAVIVGPEAPEKWMESTHPHDVVVRGNDFDRANFRSPGAPPVSIQPLPGQPATDVSVENNTTTLPSCP